MNTLNILYNTLIHRDFTPPYPNIGACEVKPLQLSSLSTLLHTVYARGGRVSLFLFVAMVSLLSLSCAKEDGDEGDSGNVVTYQEQEWDWGDSSKYNPGGFTLDTTWDGDTTIYF